METRLTADKLGRLTDMVDNFLSKSKCQKRETYEETYAEIATSIERY